METKDIPLIVLAMLAGVGIEKMLVIAGLLGAIVPPSY